MHTKKPQTYLHMLNDKIIIEIIEYLDFWSMFQLSRFDNKFRQIIGKNAIARNGLNLNGISEQIDGREILKYFGEFTTKLNIAESHIKHKESNVSFATELFNQINLHCPKLENLTVYFDLRNRSRFQINDSNGLKNVKQLSLIYKIPYGSRQLICIDDILQIILSKCVQLNSLTLNNLNTSVPFLLVEPCQSISSLRLKGCEIHDKTNWEKFLDKPNESLECFEIESFYGYRMNNGINFNGYIDRIVYAMPKLKKLSILPEFYSLDLNDEPDFSPIVQLRSLTSIGIRLTLMHPSHVAFLYSLAEQNLIKELTIAHLVHEYTVPPTMLIRLASFTSLQSIHFKDPPSKGMAMMQIFGALPCITECRLSKTSSLTLKIIKMIRSPLLQRVYIEESKFTFFVGHLLELDEHRGMVCPGMSKLKIYLEAYNLRRVRAKLRTQEPKYVEFCLLKK